MKIENIFLKEHYANEVDRINKICRDCTETDTEKCYDCHLYFKNNRCADKYLDEVINFDDYMMCKKYRIPF